MGNIRHTTENCCDCMERMVLA